MRALAPSDSKGTSRSHYGSLLLYPQFHDLDPCERTSQSDERKGTDRNSTEHIGYNNIFHGGPARLSRNTRAEEPLLIETVWEERRIIPEVQANLTVSSIVDQGESGKMYLSKDVACDSSHSWVRHSGATDHMTPDSDNMIDYKQPVTK